MFRGKRGVSTIVLGLIIVAVVGSAAVGAYFVLRPTSDIQVENVNVTRDKVGLGNSVTVEVTVVNNGDAAGTRKIPLKLNGEVIKKREVSLESGESKTISFETTEQKVGTYSAASGEKSENFEYVEPAKFEVSNLDITPLEARPLERVEISVDVKNVGQLEGKHHLELKIDGTVDDYRDLSLEPGESKTVTFTVNKRDTKTYSVEIGELSGSFEIVGPTANAGGSYTVDEVHNHEEDERTVSLDGTESKAPLTSIESYDWEIISDPTGEVKLTSKNSDTPTLYSPNNVDSETEVRVRLTVTNTAGTTAKDQAEITIKPYNEPPQIESISPSSSTPAVEEPNNQTFSVTATDEEDSNLTYTWTGDLSGSGNKTTYEGSWDPNHDDEQLDVNVKVEDSGGKSQNESWDLTVQDVNRPPEISLGGPFSVDEDHGLDKKSITLDGNDFSDPEGDSLTYDWRILSDTYASLSDSNSSTPGFDSVPEVSNSKSIEVEVKVEDGYGGEAKKTVPVSIEPYQELAHKYTPVLYFEESENYYPVDPDFDGDSNVSNNKDTYSKVLPKSVFIHRLSKNGKIYLQYWYYYVYSKGVDMYIGDILSHKDDWEFIQVVLNSGKDPIEVDYGSHGEITSHDWGEVDKEFSHPVSYVDGDRHANAFDKEGYPSNTIYPGDYPISFDEKGAELEVDEMNKKSVFLGIYQNEANGYRYVDYSWGVTNNFDLPEGYDSHAGAPWKDKDIWFNPEAGSY